MDLSLNPNPSSYPRKRQLKRSKKAATILFIRVLENHVFLYPEIERSIAAYSSSKNQQLPQQQQQQRARG
jgi:hypothetical protein